MNANRPLIPEHTRTLRALAIVQKPTGIAPNQRFRIEQWAPQLERQHAIEIHFDCFESPELMAVLYEQGHRLKKARLVLRDAWRRWQRRAQMRRYDAAIVVRQAMLVGGAVYERYLSRSGIPFVYDFDDAIWLWTPSVRNGMFNLATAPWKTKYICRMASAVTVGNEYLADFARRYNRETYIVPTTIDVERYHLHPDPGDSIPFTLVWTGSHTTLPYLDLIRRPLEQLAARRRVRLRVICDTPPSRFEGVETDFIPWNATTEPEDLAESHVGIMPLPDNPYTRGKCGCKALQYMAIGRPVVASPVGINREVIRHGANGYLAGSHQDWIAGLERLALDQALRLRLGREGRRTVLGRYTADASAAAFARVLHGIAR